MTRTTSQLWTIVNENESCRDRGVGYGAPIGLAAGRRWRPRTVRRAIGKALDALRRLDGCFVNDGVPGAGVPLCRVHFEEWDWVRVNFDGDFSTAQAAVRATISRFEGDGTGASVGFSLSSSTVMGRHC